MSTFEKSSYVLGSEAWEEYCSGLLCAEERKVRLYGEHANVHDSGDGELGCLYGKAGTSHLCEVRPFIWVRGQWL